MPFLDGVSEPIQNTKIEIRCFVKFLNKRHRIRKLNTFILAEINGLSFEPNEKTIRAGKFSVWKIGEFSSKFK